MLEDVFKIPGLCVSLDGRKSVMVGDHIHVCVVSLISNTKEAKCSSSCVMWNGSTTALEHVLSSSLSSFVFALFCPFSSL